jgi:hypothetical protein
MPASRDDGRAAPTRPADGEEASAEIAAESGQDDVASVREATIRMRATVDDMIRRVLIVAVRN